MKYCRVLILLCVFNLLCGCAMQHGVNQLGETFVSYKNHQLLTKEQSKLLPRDARVARIEKDMDLVGYRYTQVSPLFDGVNRAILSIFRNQRNLLRKYKTVVDNHRDVMSFVKANEGKSKDELIAEAKRFDSMHEDDDDKIVTKLKQYQKANEGIQRENARLAAELVVEGARLVIILKDNMEEALKVEGLAMLLNLHKINKAYELSQARKHLSGVANDFIEEQKAVLDVTKEIQDILDNNL